MHPRFYSGRTHQISHSTFFWGFEHYSCNAKGFSGCEIRRNLDGVRCASVAMNMCQFSMK